MRFIKSFVYCLRNFYFLISVIPLWLMTLVYRSIPRIHIAWIETNWNIISILVLIQGACALWYYAEQTHHALVQGKPHRTLAVQTWIIGSILFVLVLSTLLEANGVHWADVLYRLCVVALPLAVFWIYGFNVHAEKEVKNQQEEKQPGKQEVSPVIPENS